MVPCVRKKNWFISDSTDYPYHCAIQYICYYQIGCLFFLYAESDTTSDAASSLPDIVLYDYSTGVKLFDDGISEMNRYFKSKYPGQLTILDLPIKRLAHTIQRTSNHCAIGLSDVGEVELIRPVFAANYRIYRYQQTAPFDIVKANKVGIFNGGRVNEISTLLKGDTVIVNSRHQLIKLLTSQRVDYIVGMDLIFDTILAELHDEQIVAEGKLISITSYFSCSRNSHSDVIRWIAKIWDDGRANGDVGNIYEKYGHSWLMPELNATAHSGK